jgi:large subunit ribosomal protein L7/L12
MADLNAIVEQLGKLTVVEAAELVKKLEETWGVTAAAPVAAAAAGAAPAAAAPAAEAKTEFDLILVSVPAEKKIAAIKAVREVKPGLGLAEAKALVEGAPKPVLEGANKADTDAARKTRRSRREVEVGNENCRTAGLSLPSCSAPWPTFMGRPETKFGRQTRRTGRLPTVIVGN